MMAGGSIDKGSAQARLVMGDDRRLAGRRPCAARVPNRTHRERLRQGLLVADPVLGGTIESIAEYAGQTFDEALPGLLVQMAARTESDDASDVARQRSPPGPAVTTTSW